MRILAIDTALGSCSACVLEQGQHDVSALEQIVIERGHAEALIPLIARVMAKVAGGFAALDRIAVTVGPGSFTGLRVGLSAARAIGLAASRPVVGVTTLAAYCAPMIGREAGRMTAAAIDARHGQVYFHALAADGSVLAGARQCSVRDAVRSIGKGPVSLSGSGALLVAQEAWSIGLDAVVVEAAAGPDIRWVARLGLLADERTALPRPLYLRAADAQPQDNGRLPRQTSAP
jgi:tRNA threonylcarbamoyladenosine biosynthesis protein TsaB